MKQPTTHQDKLLALPSTSLCQWVGRVEDAQLGTGSNIKRAIASLEQYLECPEVTLSSFKEP